MSTPHPSIPDSPLADRSLQGVVLCNLFTLVAAVVNEWSLAPLLWVYWGQSVVIGVVSIARILRLRKFSTAGLSSNGRQVPETRAGQIQAAGFFAIHFGMFHFVYGVFLASGAIGGRTAVEDVPGVLLAVGGFAVAHTFSLLWNEPRDYVRGVPNLGTIMFFPYLRIVPMHLTILFGSLLAGFALPLFIGLKTVADAIAHTIEHTAYRRILSVHVGRRTAGS